MDINSQHQNLLGNQISPKSEDFCMLAPLSHSKPTMDIDSQHHNLVGIFFFAQIGGFLYFGGNFGFKMATIANQLWMSIRNIINYLETKFRRNRKIFVFGGHFVPWLPWQRPPFSIFQNSKSCHTLWWIFLQSFMKGIQFCFKFPLFFFHGNCGKVCPTDSDFFGLSHSTWCGCCSYQVSSISVQRVICYDYNWEFD